MALYANIVGFDIVETGRIDNIRARRPSGVLAPWAVTLFASHIPFCDCLRTNVVVD